MNEQKTGSKMTRNKFIKTVAGVILVAVMTIFTSCEKDEIITPTVEETNTIVVRVNGETYRLEDFNYTSEAPYLQSDINSEAAAVWLGLPDTEADFWVLWDRVANLTIEVVSYTNDFTESEVWWTIYNSLTLALYNHIDLDDIYQAGIVLRDGAAAGGSYSDGNIRYTVIFL